MHRVLSRAIAPVILSAGLGLLATEPAPAQQGGGLRACQDGGGGARCEQIRQRIRERIAAQGGPGQAGQGGRSKEEIRAAIAERAREQGGGAPAARLPVPELETLTLEHGGLERSYHVEPSTLADGAAVLMLLHGARGTGERIAAAARITETAKEGGFAVIYPVAAGPNWSDGRETTEAGVDDVGFLRAVAEDAAVRFGLDETRVFAAGISNGGMMAQRLACEAGDLFKGFGVIVGNMPADLAAGCAPEIARPMVFLHGTEDALVPFEGGDLSVGEQMGGAGGTVLSHEAMVAFWRDAREGCAEAEEGGFDRVTDGTKVATIRYDCEGNADLAFFVISGGGHNWPGSGAPSRRLTGTVTQEIDAAEAIVEFLGPRGLGERPEG